MKMSKNILNIPPYLSTPWKNVSSFFLDRGILKVELTSGTVVEIPGLDEASIHAIYAAHAQHLEEESGTPAKGNQQPFTFKLPINMEGGLSNFTDLMQHNSEQMHAAPLPQDILKKISEMAKAVGMGPEMFPKPEPHCNCPHCQMARAIHQLSEDEQQAGTDEEITAEDLRFRDWDIRQTGDKLYRITNPLDTNEHFDVFLGTPVGCTCGEKDCEHIRAVLRS